MALTINILEVFVVGDRKEVWFDATFDATYPDEGEPFDPANKPGDATPGINLELGARVEDGLAVAAAGENAAPVHYDDVAKTLVAYEYNGAETGVARLQEVAAGAGVDGFVARLRAVGKGSAVA